MILSHLNYLAVIVATIVYFAIGALWFSVLFSKAWMAGHHIPAPTDADKEKMNKQMPRNMLVTFICCLAGVVALGYIETAVMYHGCITGLKIGILGAVFASIGIALNHMYTGKTIKVFLVDAGYHVVGLIISALILSVWR